MKQWNALPVTMKHTTRRLIEIGIDQDSQHLWECPDTIQHNPTIKNKSHNPRTASIQETEKKRLRKEMYDTKWNISPFFWQELKVQMIKKTVQVEMIQPGDVVLAAQLQKHREPKHSASLNKWYLITLQSFHPEA